MNFPKTSNKYIHSKKKKSDKRYVISTRTQHVKTMSVCYNLDCTCRQTEIKAC